MAICSLTSGCSDGPPLHMLFKPLEPSLTLFPSKTCIVQAAPFPSRTRGCHCATSSSLQQREIDHRLPRRHILHRLFWGIEHIPSEQNAALAVSYILLTSVRVSTNQVKRCWWWSPANLSPALASRARPSIVLDRRQFISYVYRTVDIHTGRRLCSA